MYVCMYLCTYVVIVVIGKDDLFDSDCLSRQGLEFRE